MDLINAQNAGTPDNVDYVGQWNANAAISEALIDTDAAPTGTDFAIEQGRAYQVGLKSRTPITWTIVGKR